MNGNVHNDKFTKNFIEHNMHVWGKEQRNNIENEVLVEFCGLQHCVLSWSYLVNLLAEKYDASIYTYCYKTKIRNCALYEVYRSFNTKGYIVEKLSGNDEDRKRKYFTAICADIKKKEDVLRINIEGLNVGVDVYEEYLIRAGHPTVDINDGYLKEIISKAVDKVIFWNNYFKSGKVKAVIVSHDCYLGNIIRRVANRYNISTYQVTTGWGIRLNEDYDGGANYKYYRKFFNQLSDQKKEEGIKWAKVQLARRFAGEVGVDMDYSKKSSFNPVFSSEENVLDKNDKFKVLICTHCFFDNPYGCGSLLFVDFYEWLCFLGEMSEVTDYDWYIKPHPDYRPGTLETLGEITAKYPRLKLISPVTSHQQLVHEGIRVVLTVHGTVGCEYPLMGVQVINAGSNPHEAYDFNWHPRTVEEYRKLILDLPNLEKIINKEDVYEFYCVHHLYAKYDSAYRGQDDLIFLSEKSMKEDLNDSLYTSKMYEYFLNEITPNRHIQIKENMERLLKFMDRCRNDDIGLGDFGNQAVCSTE